MDGRIRVLHVDDDPDLTDVTASFLEREDDFDVDTTTDVAEALDRIDADRYDCVISDYQMPDRDGLGLLEAVRRDHPDLPFILFTGHGSEEIASEAISAGVTDYLQKTTSTDQYTVLANRVRNAVEKYRAEREVDRAQQRFRKLIEHSTDIIFISDGNGRFTYLSSSVEGILGYEPHELEGESGFDYIHPDDVDEATAQFFDAIEDPSHRPELEFRVRHKDGGYRVLEARGRNLLDDPVVEGFVVNARDITDRRRREDELELFRRLTDAANDEIFVIDPETAEFMDVNRAACDRLGYPRDELLAMTVLDIQPDFTSLDDWHDHVDAVREDGSRVIGGVHHTKDGGTLPVEVNVVYTEVGGEDYMFAIAREIGKRARGV